MADPLSISASALAVITAAIVSIKSLKTTVTRFKGRDKFLRMLNEELEDLLKILNMLKDISQFETSMMLLLEGPVGRCTQLCREFEDTMKKFDGKSKTSFRDWTKLEFMRGNIDEFMDTLSTYKATISIGLGTVTLRTSKASLEALESYSETIENTTYHLHVVMQRIEEKLAQLPTITSTSDARIDLKDEQAVTKQCLRICENAKSYLESLMNEEPISQHGPPLQFSPDGPNGFEAQRLTSKVLDENRDNFAKSIGRLQERLDILESDGGPGSDRERLRLQQDISASMQCLEVCKMASNEVSRQKIYNIGEAIADNDSDQVVVTSLADLFDIKTARSTGRSAQWIGSMTDETIQKLSGDRYNSRFGALVSDEADASIPIEMQTANNSLSHETGHDEQQGNAPRRPRRANPNEDCQKERIKWDKNTHPSEHVPVPREYFIDKWEITLAIQRVPKDYYEAVALCSEMVGLKPPPERTTKALEHFVSPSGSKTDYPQSSGAASRYLADREDLFSLHPPRDDDLGTKPISTSFLWLLQVLVRILLQSFYVFAV